MKHDTRELFCRLARDCNYRDEKIARDVYFKSGLYCMRQNIVFKALVCFGSFLKLYMYIQIETFISAITSHEKQRVKYQTEMQIVSQKQQFYQEVKLQVKFSAEKNILKL